MKAKDIKGFLVEPVESHGAYTPGAGAHNSVIKLQGEVQIGLNREALAKHIYYGKHRTSICIPFKDLEVKDMYYQIADFLIAKLPEIIEVHA